MIFFIVTRKLFPFSSQKVISSAFYANFKFSQIKGFHVSRHPRVANNKMADGTVVEEYSKRAKIAVRFLIQLPQAFPHTSKVTLTFFIFIRRMKC